MRIRLLIVGNDAGDVESMRGALDRAEPPRFEITIAGRLSEAREAAARGPFDAAVVALTLPDSHGADTLIGVAEAAPKLAIVAVVDSQEAAAALDLLPRGAQDCLVKGQDDFRSLPKSILLAVERKRIEESLRACEEERGRLQRQLARLERLGAVDQMVAEIVHDVNQPLCSIVNYAKACTNVFAHEEPNLDMAGDWCRRIASEAVRAGDIVRRLRDGVEASAADGPTTPSTTRGTGG